MQTTLSRPRTRLLLLTAAVTVAGLALTPALPSANGVPTRQPIGHGGAVAAVREPDRVVGQVSGMAEKYINRAYPRAAISAAEATRAQRAFTSHSKRNASWHFAGPSVGTAPGLTTESLRPSVTSGRVTGLAVAPNCGRKPHHCRVYVASAGGGVWRTRDGLAKKVRWKAVDNGLPTQVMGTIVLDPNDKTGHTLYAGTGEANVLNAPGLGLFKTTDGGNHWTLVPGSTAVARDRAMGAVRIDPHNPNTIWIGTSAGRLGQSAVNGGAREPLDAPELGVYRSIDGGQTFQLQLSQPHTLNDFDGGVTDIELDPADPSTVYATFYGYGMWRSSPQLDGTAAWQQVYAPRFPGYDDQRLDLALTRVHGHTRGYLLDGGSDANTFDPYVDFYRAGNLNRPAAELSDGTNNPGWTLLSTPVDGTPGYAVHNFCGFQCSYDMFVEVAPTRPNTVWIGGSMTYEEIRPLQDLSLKGVAANRSNGRAVLRSTDGGMSWTDIIRRCAEAALRADPP